jgi:S1-C subfamily serine protease
MIKLAMLALLVSCTVPYAYIPINQDISPSIQYLTIAKVSITDKSDNSLVYGSAVPFKKVGDEVYFLTCKHVIGRYINERRTASQPSDYRIGISLTLHSNGKMHEEVPLVTVVAASGLDIAIIKCAPKTTCYFLSFHDQPIQHMQQVVAIGCPFDLDPIFTTGLISLNRQYDFSSASIAPGNSGGGLFDAKTGRLVGITTAIYQMGGQLYPHLSIFIPVEKILPWLKEIGQ